jgi:hypothetical protein
MELEKVQGKLLKMLLKLPDGTPYWGLLNELGIWPLEDLLNYKKFMLLQNLMNSDDSRVTKNLVNYQKKYEIESSWSVNLKEIGARYGIQMENDELLTNKQAWKKHVKEQIHQNIIERSVEKIESMTKLRHQKNQNFTMQSYIKETNIWRIRDLIKVKLEMLDIGRNQGSNRLCYGCNKAEETTEHIIHCEHLKDLAKADVPPNLDMMSDRRNLLQIHDFLTTYIKQRNVLLSEESSTEDNESTHVDNEEDASRSSDNNRH